MPSYIIVILQRLWLISQGCHGIVVLGVLKYA